MSDAVQYAQDGHVVTITYNRPEALNAVNGEMRRGLNDAFSRFRDDTDAWVAIVTGAGRAFCSGGDMKDGAGAIGEFAGTFWEKPTTNSFESGWEIFKPVIAAVNGYCLGYGLTLVSWCDFVIASERAEFGFPEVTLGQPTIVGAIRMPQRLNWQYAMELLLTGDRIDAAREGDRARGLGGPPRRPDGRGPRPCRAAGQGGADRGARHERGRGAHADDVDGRGHPLRRDHAQGRRHRGGRHRAHARTTGRSTTRVEGPLTRVRRSRVPARYRPRPMDTSDTDRACAPADLSTMCLACGAPMREEHAHYRCPECGWRDSCCDGPY